MAQPFLFLPPSAVHSSFLVASPCIGPNIQFSEFLPIVLVTPGLSQPLHSLFSSSASPPSPCRLRVLTEALVLQKILLWLVFTVIVADFVYCIQKGPFNSKGK